MENISERFKDKFENYMFVIYSPIIFETLIYQNINKVNSGYFQIYK